VCWRNSSFRSRTRGVSLLELLVALLIAMLIALAAFASANAFGAAQRQAVSAGTTSAQLVSALSAIKAEIGSASLGFTIGGVNRCTSWNLAEAGITLADNAVFVPFTVTRDAATQTDRLELVLASDVKAAAPVRLAAAAAPSALNMALRGWLPVQAGERVLIAPREPGAACTVRAVTGSSNAVPGGAPYTLQLAPASFSSPFSYEANDQVSVLGRLDRRRIELNANGELVMTSSLLGASAVLAEQVLAWRVQYGVAAPGSSSVEWVDPTGAWASLSGATAPRVRALRLGLLARSPQREKQCDATTTLPQLFGADVDVSAVDPTAWQCFRYRGAEVVVPLRNVAWGSP
jgi:type IV pilus assembly protein PilW